METIRRYAYQIVDWFVSIWMVLVHIFQTVLNSTFGAFTQKEFNESTSGFLLFCLIAFVCVIIFMWKKLMERH